jgi:hypothetical protein
MSLTLVFLFADATLTGVQSRCKPTLGRNLNVEGCEAAVRIFEEFKRRFLRASNLTDQQDILLNKYSPQHGHRTSPGRLALPIDFYRQQDCVITLDIARLPNPLHHTPIKTKLSIVSSGIRDILQSCVQTRNPAIGGITTPDRWLWFYVWKPPPSFWFHSNPAEYRERIQGFDLERMDSS